MAQPLQTAMLSGLRPDDRVWPPPRVPHPFRPLDHQPSPAPAFIAPDSGARDAVRALLRPAENAEARRAWLLLGQGALIALVTGAARMLGAMWLEDECTFTDVTLAMHELTLLLIDWEQAQAGHRRPAHGGQVLVAPGPGDQHSFGCALVAMVLRRAGWDVTADVPGAREPILAAVRACPFHVAALSVGHERAIGPVAALIGDMRRCSLNREIRIALGGPMIDSDPDLARRMGADLWAEDAEALARRMEPLLETAV